MYMGEPAIAGMADVDGTKKPGTAPASGTDDRKTVSQILGKYLGRIDIATNYGIVGDTNSWYVYYTLQDGDSAKVKTILANKANAAGLLGAADSNLATLTADTTTYYTTTDAVIALKVR